MGDADLVVLRLECKFKQPVTPVYSDVTRVGCTPFAILMGKTVVLVVN